jgi:hypothetical protein
MNIESQGIEEWRDRALAAEDQLRELKAALTSLLGTFPLTQEGIDRLKAAMDQAIPPTQGITCLNCGRALPWRRAEWTAYCSNHCAKAGEGRSTRAPPSLSLLGPAHH